MGQRYVFGEGYPAGFGEHRAAKDTGRELSDDMRALDLRPGTEVEHIGTDAERGLELIRWSEGDGAERTMTVEPRHLGKHFRAVDDAE